MTTIAYQLYCSRNWKLDETLRMLEDTGYGFVEGHGGLFDGDEAALHAKLDSHGLSMPSAHMGLDLVEGDPERALDIAKSLGVQKIIVPHIAEDKRPKDAKGWETFGTRLAEAGKPILDAGLIFGWHNHDFEFADLGGDDLPLDLIAQGSDDIMLELDLGWTARAGQDPVAWINKYSGRITAAHVKDIAKGGTTEEDGWADVGHGTMQWMPVVAALTAAGVSHLVAEHDNPSDHARFARRSLDTIESF